MNTIEDKLFLPTEWEMRGSNETSHTTETAANQGRFVYYADDAKRIKYNSSNAAAEYWQASPLSNDGSALFCNVYPDGSAGGAGASDLGGCAPAFCVK